MMPDPTYSISIEFEIGSFTEVGSDCLHFTISRNSASLDDILSVSRASFRFDNFDGRYSPSNSASPFYPYITPNKKIKIQATHVGTTYDLFSGFVDRYKIDPALSNRAAIIEASDRVKQLQLQVIDLPIAVDINVGSLFTDILSASGVASADRQIDEFSEVIPFSWYRDVRPTTAIKDLIDFGFYRAYIGGDGTVRIKNRYWNSAGSIVASYVNDFHGLDYALTEDKITNEARVTGVPRKVGTAASSVAWLESFPSIAASASIGFWLSYVDPDNREINTPCQSMETPVNSLDYTTNTQSDGGGIDRTSVASASVSFFGASAVCSIFNGSGDVVYLTKFILRGTPIQRQPEIRYQDKDDSSENVYGKRDTAIVSDFIGSPGYAQDYVTFLLRERKEPTPKIGFELKNIFPDVLKREMGDLIHVVESNAAVNEEWTIRAIEHDVVLARGLEHTSRYDIEKWVDREWLILDHSERGLIGTNRFGF